MNAKYINIIKLKFCLILLIIIVLTLCCKNTTKVDESEVFDHDVPGNFYSTNVQDTFKIYLKLPSNYADSDSLTYPVIYLLDADYWFDGTHPWIDDGGVEGIVDSLNENGTLPELIVVAIGYPSTDHRNRDLLYPKDITWPTSGGGDKFYLFIKEELIPFIDTNFRTKLPKERTLIGHSLSGYFASYVMFKGDNLFHKYIVISPYNQYYDYFIFDMESQYYENSGGELNVHLYLSVSGSEAWRITDAYEKMLERLHERKYQNFVVKNRKFDQDDHYTVVRPSIEDGLAWSFEK